MEAADVCKLTETCVCNVHVVMCLLNCSNVTFSVIFPVEMFIESPVYQCCFASLLQVILILIAVGDSIRNAYIHVTERSIQF